MNDILNDEEKKEKQAEYLRKLAVIEKDILSRTVFVTNAQDLALQTNIDKLKHFMETQYGPVELCTRAEFEGRKKNKPAFRYPAGRVRFQRREHAEKIFGCPLNSAKPQIINCSIVGNRGTLRIQPAKPFDSMVDDELKGQNLTISVKGVAFGCWIPSFDDIYETWRHDQPRGDKPEEWLEDCEVNSSRYSLSMKMDLNKRQVEIRAQVIGIFLANAEFLCFRFKDLRNHIDLCRGTDGKFFLVFALKMPPKLYVEEGREVSFAGINGSDFGCSLGLKVTIEEAAATRVLLHEGLEQLHNFGILPKRLHAVHHALHIKTVSITALQRVDRFRQFMAGMVEVHSKDAETGKCQSLLLVRLIDS